MTKVALVTGAGRRVGLEIARFLLKRDYCVIAHYNASGKVLREIAEGTEKLIPVAANLLEESALDLLAKTTESHGRLDLLINNASVFYRTPLEGITYQHLDEFHRLHVSAPLLLSQKLKHLLEKTESSMIVNMTDSGARRLWKGYLPYCLSKNSLEDLTRGLAVQLAPVRVNAIAPGHVLASEDNVGNELLERNLLKRQGSTDDVIQALDYLLKAQFVTGTILDLHGGRDLRIHGTG